MANDLSLYCDALELQRGIGKQQYNCSSLASTVEQMNNEMLVIGCPYRKSTKMTAVPHIVHRNSKNRNVETKTSNAYKKKENIFIINRIRKKVF